MPILATLVFLASAAFLATPYYFLAVLPPIGLAFFFALYRKPEIGYFIIIFLIPYGNYRKIGGINIPWLIAAALILVLFLRFIFHEKPALRFSANFWPWLLLLFGVSAMSTYFSDFRETSLANLALQAVAFLFILFGLLCITPKGFSRTLPSVLVASISIGSLLAVLGFFFGIDWFAPKGQAGGDYGRGEGGALDPNNMAMMILFVMPLIIYRILNSPSVVRKIFGVALILLNLAALLTTYSRSGLLVTGGACALLIFENRHRFRLQTSLMAILGLMLIPAAILPFMPDTFWERHASLGAWQDTALKRRTTYLYVGWDTFVEHPLIGSGPGTFRDYYAQSDYARLFARRDRTLRRFAHNTYVEYFVGGGLLGGFAFLMTAWVTFRNFGRAKSLFLQQQNPKLASLAAHYRISFVTLMAFLFVFSEPYHKYMLFAIPLSQVALWLAQGEKEVVSPFVEKKASASEEIAEPGDDAESTASGGRAVGFAG